MPRKEFVGEPENLIRIAPKLLPANKKLADCRFEYCDLSGLDLSQFTMPRVTISRCVAKGIIFPPRWEMMAEFHSRCHYEGGDPRPYEGATIPFDRPEEEQHDLVVEILFQAADKMGEPDASHVRAVAVLLQDYENGCYETGVALALERMGKMRHVVALFAPIFQPYPNLLRGFTNHAPLPGRQLVDGVEVPWP